jgi:hypothetical protein
MITPTIVSGIPINAMTHKPRLIKAFIVSSAKLTLHEVPIPQTKLETKNHVIHTIGKISAHIHQNIHAPFLESVI